MEKLATINAAVHSEMQAVDELMASHLHTDIDIIKQLGQHIIGSGGKRLRPLLVLLGAKLFDYQGQAHIQLATSVEFFHTATLLHDDVIDESQLRRGKPTANKIWGSKASVLVGDFLFTRAFQIMINTKNHAIIEVLANASNTITKGEVLQLINSHDININEANYMDIICSKTATLFQASAQLGALLTDQSHEVCAAISSYGLHLGNAFQLVDDALDYCAETTTLGKNIGDDLAEGKLTLPLIYSLQHSSPAQKQVIQQAIQQGGAENLDAIMDAIQETNAIDYAYKIAEQQIDTALTELQAIPASEHRKMLEQLAQFAIERKH